MNSRGIYWIQSEGQRKAKITPRIGGWFWIDGWCLPEQGLV